MRHGDVNTPLPENLRDPVDGETATMRLQDFFLILSQCIDLGLLSITAAFGAARDLKKILCSGFEMIRIRVSQCQSPRVFLGLWRLEAASSHSISVVARISDRRLG
jgi:hypothetical protein